MAEMVGVILGAAALVPIAVEVIHLGRKCAQEFREWDEDARRLALQMSLHMSTTELMHNVLFKQLDRNGTTLFDRMDTSRQAVISCVFCEFRDAIVAKYRLLQAAYNLRDASEESLGREVDSAQTRPGRSRRAWMFGGRRKVEAVVKLCEFWTEKLWALLQIQIMGDHPLNEGPFPSATFPNESLETLVNNSDAEKLGLRNELEIAEISSEAAGVDSTKWLSLDLEIYNLELDKEEAGSGVLRTLRTGKWNGRRVLLDLKYFTPDTQSQNSSLPEDGVLRRIRQLASLLNKRHSHMQRARVLECVGLHRLRDENAFCYVFRFPSACFGSPISLRDLLSRQSKRSNARMPSLEHRLRLALTLAVALFQFHAVGWIHKSLRSGNIIFIPDDADAAFPDLSRPWLVGLEYAREDPGFSEIMPVHVAHDIYRHPDNWGTPTGRFQKIHDIYSLGVVLLEIGLWRSAFQLEQSGFRSMLHSEREQVQQLFIEKTKTELPFYTGSIYASVVRKCLQGRFGGGGDSGLDYNLTEATHSSYQEEIVEALRSISFQSDTSSS